MMKCKNADNYKAIYPPRCNNGDPCRHCAAKWANRGAREIAEANGHYPQEHGEVMRAIGHSNSSEEFGSQEHSVIMDAILG